MLFLFLWILKIKVHAQHIGAGTRIKIIVDAAIDLGIHSIVFGHHQHILHIGAEAQIGFLVQHFPEIIPKADVVNPQERSVLHIVIRKVIVGTSALEAAAQYLPGTVVDVSDGIENIPDGAAARSHIIVDVVADIGGGKGQLINQIAKAGNITQGILFDLPETVAQTNGLHPLCVQQGGSFFEPINIKADIFVLKRILHDWDDQQALQILKNISSTMIADSRLYIIDGILDYSQDKKLLAAIDLALLTISQGQERTRAEFENLIAQAGLQVVGIKPINGLICAIECKKF